MERNKLVDSLSKSGSASLLKGAEIGAKTFENQIIFSGVAIGLLLTFWQFHTKTVDVILMSSTLSCFLIAAVFSNIRNYYAGHCIFGIGEQYLIKCDLMIYSNRDQKNELNQKYKEAEKKTQNHNSWRKFFSLYSRVFFFLAIFLSILTIISS